MSDGSTIAIPAERRAFALPAGVWTVLLFSLGHFFVDLYSGAMGIFQPFLVHKLGLSLTQAGLLGGFFVFNTSVTQPIWGYLSDRYRTRLFSALAPAVAGLFIAGIGLAPSFTAALLLVLLGGAGVSAFHPQGSSWSTARLQSGRPFWMAVFISSGTLGFALAPAFFSAWIDRFGFEGTVWAASGGVAATLLLLLWVRPPASGSAARGFDWSPLRRVWKPLTILYLAVFFRSAVQVTYGQFLALYLTRERALSIHQAAWILTVYLAAGAIGGIVGGRLSERIGPRRVIMASFALSVPFMAVFFLLPGWWGIASLVFGGLILLFTIPVNVVVAQDLVPQSAGTVSALMMGFSWGTAGLLFIPLTGWISDHSSLHAALFSLLIWPVVGYFLTARLPKDLGR